MSKNIDEVYLERNILVALLSKHYKSCIEREDGDWVICYIQLPTGQVSYHISDDQYRLHFNHLEIVERNSTWDGHDTDLKNSRIVQLIESDEIDYNLVSLKTLLSFEFKMAINDLDKMIESINSCNKLKEIDLYIDKYKSKYSGYYSTIRRCADYFGYRTGQDLHFVPTIENFTDMTNKCKQAVEAIHSRIKFLQKLHLNEKCKHLNFVKTSNFKKGVM
jgi:hypothetical protein